MPHLVRPETFERIREHRVCSHEAVLISASSSQIFEKWAQPAGCDAMLAARFIFENDGFVARR
ncbi:haloacid dehalogenase-like hydrolase [Burkholderia ubonensis]|uniref:haloacid dehalogenase-like hydrolase n=1 Tax=Burkholderia ubonensis TaxID=101571 RepID=UPI0039F4A60A